MAGENAPGGKKKPAAPAMEKTAVKTPAAQAASAPASALKTDTAEILPQGFTEITARQVLVETAGIGTAEFRDAVEALGKKIIADGAEKHEKEMADLLTAARRMLDAEKGATIISVSADAQFADYIGKHPKAKVRRAEWAFQKLFFLRAFALSEKGETAQALAALDELIKFAPYCSDAFCERGYLLNRDGKPEKALESYQKAAELAEAYGTERHNQPVALRGAGFALTSLGKYADARQAYTKSLEFAPGNKIATDGISALNQLEKKQ